MHWTWVILGRKFFFLFSFSFFSFLFLFLSFFFFTNGTSISINHETYWYTKLVDRPISHDWFWAGPITANQSINQSYRERGSRKWKTALSGKEARKRIELKRDRPFRPGGYGGASSSAAAASEAAAANDGGGGRQEDEGKGRQEEERPTAAGASGGESELQVRSDELRSTWDIYESSLGLLYFSLCLLTVNTVNFKFSSLCMLASRLEMFTLMPTEKDIFMSLNSLTG